MLYSFKRVLNICVPLLLSNTRTMSHAESPKHDFYQMKEVKIGVEVRGIDLKQNVSPEVIEQIKKDTTKHRLLIFKDQGVISGQRHVEISHWFGDLESTFYKHPKSPHPDVFRVSNDETEGCTNVGRTGWHIDGSFQPAPFAYSIYHMVSVPKEGDTAFVPLHELIMSLSEEKRQRWERLWMASNMRDDRLHPLVYAHPETGIKTICFHLGMTEGFVYDYKTDNERWTDMHETREILREIKQAITKNNSQLVYSHKWEDGDFIISDNLAVGHEATPQTQYSKSKVGLRVLHRTTIKGKKRPSKTQQIEMPRSGMQEL